MNRRLASTVAVLAAGVLCTVPAHAAAPKKKPAPINKTYSLNLPPDPTGETTGLPTVKDGCSGVNPASQDKRVWTVPGKGTLHVVLDSPDPTGHGVTDWDLWVLDSDGSTLDKSVGSTSHEETTDTFKKGQKVTFWVCNLLGQPSATVHYVFTYA